MVEVSKAASGKIACSCCGKVLDNRVYHFCPWCGTRQTQNDGVAQVNFSPNYAQGYFCPSCHNYVQLDTAFHCEMCGLDLFAPTGDNTVFMEDDDN